jgi:hypothetical protein
VTAKRVVTRRLPGRQGEPGLEGVTGRKGDGGIVRISAEMSLSRSIICS